MLNGKEIKKNNRYNYYTADASRFSENPYEKPKDD